MEEKYTNSMSMCSPWQDIQRKSTVHLFLIDIRTVLNFHTCEKVTAPLEDSWVKNLDSSCWGLQNITHSCLQSTFFQMVLTFKPGNFRSETKVFSLYRKLWQFPNSHMNKPNHRQKNDSVRSVSEEEETWAKYQAPDKESRMTEWRGDGLC